MTMTQTERNTITDDIYRYAIEHGLYSPKHNYYGFCRTDKPNYYDGIECGEVYSDFWHVYVFDDGTFQLGWLELTEYGTALFTKSVETIEEVKQFLDEQ